MELHVIVPDKGPVLRVRSLVGHAGFVLKNALRGEFRALRSGVSSECISFSLGEGRIAAQFHHIDMTRGALAALGQRFGLDVLLPSGFPLGSAFPIPWVGYIDDFQYKYLPNYYEPAFRRKRDRFLARMLTEPKAVVMLSMSACRDAKAFLPNLSAELVPLPFAADCPQDWLGEKEGVAEKYDIAARYFMICNQFWMSKRHDVAFAAFAQLAKEDDTVQLVCTGRTEDHRDLGYFPRLLTLVRDLGLSDRIKILGFIPKVDQIALMRNCIALIQPTEFEGQPGGLSVNDAVAIGVRTIVSDIPVNREIEEWVTSYFPLNDIDALHHTMSQMMRSSPPSPDTGALRELGRERRLRCAQALLDAARLAMGWQSANSVGLQAAPTSSNEE